MTDQTASLPLPRARPMAGAGGAISDLPWPVGLYLFVVLVPISAKVGPLVMTSLRLMLLAMVVPLAIQLVAGRFGRVRATDVLFLAFVLWSGLSIGVNNPTRAVEYVGSTGLEFFGGYLMGRAYIRTPQAFMALARTLILLMLVTMPLAVFETLTGRSLLIEMLKNLPFGLGTTSGDNTMPARLGLTRVQLTFAHPIHYGVFGTTVFALAFVALKGQTPTPLRYLSSAAIGICIFISVSSGAVLALLIQIMLIAWATLFAGMKRRWHLLVALVVTTYVVIDVLSTRTPVDVFLSYATFNSHTAYWRSIIFDWGMTNVWANPVFGIGLNDWVRPWFMGSASVDNFWLLTAMRNGIPGFLFLAAGYLVGLAQVMRRDFSADPLLRQLRLGWVITFVGMTFTLATVAIWTNIYSFVFFMFAAGLWLSEVPSAGAAPAPAAPDRGRTARRAAGGPPDRTRPHQPDLTDLPDRAAPPAGTAATAEAGPRYTRFPPAAPPPSPPRPAPRGGPPDGT
jgi:hypothetical protein